MTYAPADLLAVQRYARAKTGQDWASLGIVGDTSHNSSGGYHVGYDVLHALGRAPEDPGSDYSYTESQRDRRGLTAAASAFDLGNGFPRFLEFNAWMRGRLVAGDPRGRDVREMIHTLDGQTVRRWDALGIRSTGDSSHLGHTHFSFFRDSEGRRDRDDNFLGLLKEFFDATGGTEDMAADFDAASRIAGLPYGALMEDIHQYVVGGRPNGDDPVGRFRSPNGWRMLVDRLGGIDQAVGELRAAVIELRSQPPGSVVITDEQLERVLRRVLGSVDGASPSQD